MDVTFELAADAVVAGDLARIGRLLNENASPDGGLIRARSSRKHHATLLHYVSANGVEDFRQVTPANAVAVARLLIEAGAEVDALAEMYGGRCATLELVATSGHPARAGVQIPLLEVLLDHGAAIEGPPGAKRPLKSALFGTRVEAARFLAARGAHIDLTAAAGLGRLDLLQTFFHDDGSLKPPATPAELNEGFICACIHGHQQAVEFLLDRGADLRTNAITGQTGLHQAVLGCHADLMRFLIDRGAPLEIRNRFGGTVLGQAVWSLINSEHGERYIPAIQMLVDAGASVEEAGYPTGNARVDRLLERRGV